MSFRLGGVWLVRLRKIDNCLTCHQQQSDALRSFRYAAIQFAGLVPSSSLRDRLCPQRSLTGKFVGRGGDGETVTKRRSGVDSIRVLPSTEFSGCTLITVI